MIAVSAPKVALIMGSDSDFEKLKGCVTKLKEFKIEVDVNVISAHRTPDKAADFAKNALENGIEVIICAAGMAAHLGGVIAAHTIVPVIGIPIESTLQGMDALLATVQMPPGIPVATVGINNGTNAAILAAQILSIKYDYLKDMLKNEKQRMVEGVNKKNEKVKAAAAEL
jgi:5-(carboxyamino)imidazole ribonucleotide mutase